MYYEGNACSDRNLCNWQVYVHKGATQGFLDLFRAWFNLRTRRWGRHKGTSAHECLTGQRVHDWLTLLGYPPSPTLN